ncbi:hypothetical protein V8F20_011206 [Naviculisporaceae sp. PSN 640]
MDFLGLNQDVQRLILDYLSQSDLRNVCLTHRHLYHLAQPVLYSCVELPSGIDCGGPPKPHRITSFVRSIVSQSHLATCIRRLSFLKARNKEDDDPEYRSDHRTAPELLVASLDMEAAVHFIEKCDVPYRDAWLKALETSPMDAFLAILLMNLPAVSHLRIEAILLIETGFVGHVLRSLLCNMDPITLGQPVGHAGSLRALREITLGREDHSPMRNTPNILPVFYLPSVKKISIHLDDPAGVFSWPTSSPPRVPALESLEVSGIHEGQLKNLLSVTPGLSSLTYTREYWIETTLDPGPLVLDPTIDLGSLSLSLAMVKDSLTRLELRTYGNFNGVRIDSGWDSPVTLVGSMGSMSFMDFPNLKVLEVPCEFIMGYPVRPVLVNHLPANLEELRLSTEATSCIWGDAVFEYACEYPYLTSIWAWLTAAKTSTPKIKKFIYLAHAFDAEYEYLIHDPELLNARGEIREVADRLGIEYTRLTFSREELAWVPQD